MKKLLKTLSVAVMAVFLVAGVSSATPIITLYDGSTTIAINDNGSGDIDARAGLINYSGNIGAFSLVVTVGITKPFIGSSNLPILDLMALQVTGGNGGTLDITFSEDGFTLPPELGGFITQIGGTTQGTVSLKSYLDYDSTHIQLSNLGPFGGAFSGTNNMGVVIDPSQEFSLSLVARITQGSGAFTSFDASLTAVPEPASMLLLGSGLIGLAGVGRKKFSK